MKNIKDELVEIESLKNLLGCQDERTIEKWCIKRKCPIIKMGKKKYTVNTFLELFIMDEVKKFVSAKYENSDQIMKAIADDDKAEFAELVNAPVTPIVKSYYTAKKPHSKAAQDYINKFAA